MRKIWDKISNLDIFFGSVFALAMVTILFCNVIGRYIIRHSIPWAEEICLILFILSVYFGAAGAVKNTTAPSSGDCTVQTETESTHDTGYN